MDPVPTRTPAENLRRILQNPAYLRAYEDVGLLHRRELRPVRLQLELLKTELLLDEQEVESTVVLFGGSRIPDPADAGQLVATAERAVAEAPGSEEAEFALRVAHNLAKRAKYYGEARKFGETVSRTCQEGGRLHYVVVTGGGPGIMEAGNRGAWDAGKKTIGMNITLPFEQAPNPYITPELCFQFHYFAVRKMHLLMRARAAVFFPGGFGTLDELFETLTLVQTGKMHRIPLVLVGRDFWNGVVNWDFLAEAGTIARDDLDLLYTCETAEEAWEHICHFHDEDPTNGGDTLDD